MNNFSIEYDAINSNNIFTNGDTITGRIILDVSKEIKVQELIFRAEGRARVCWSEHYGQYHHYVYTSKEKYYDVFHHILRKTRNDGTEVVGPGRHVFPFSFNIPDRNLPSTFTSSVGKVVHKLKAELKQSMKLTKTAKTHFTFVSSADMDMPGLLEPQYGCRDKTISAFGSGTVALDVHIERLGYWQGEALKVRAEIKNQSSRDVKPKFIMYRKKSYFAQGKRRMNTKDILKEKGDIVESGCNKTVTKTITVPKELPPSILNCSIIKLEYRLKVKLDIKGATNPEVKLPIVVLYEQSNTPVVQQEPKKSKALQASAQSTKKSKALEASAQSSRHMVQPEQASAWAVQSAAGHYPSAQASDDPPPYGAHDFYPTYPNNDQYMNQF